MASNKAKQQKEERERMLKLKAKLDNRITIAKFGKTALDAGDYGGALKKFLEYLNAMAESKKCPTIYGLRPSHFDSKKDLTEMMMISHIYFEMARIYDAIPQFHPDSKSCLEQFVIFTANQPYQVVNSEMVRRKLKRLQFKNSESFRNAYMQIFVQSKKCYIVTYCYGDDHVITKDCREFKDWLIQYSWGQELVRLYYISSSHFIEHLGQTPLTRFIGQVFIRPCLMLFAKTILPLILK
jgi:hypothetical protein